MEFFVLRADLAGSEQGTRLLGYITGLHDKSNCLHKEDSVPWILQYDSSGTAVIHGTPETGTVRSVRTVLAARLADYILEEREADIAAAIADRSYTFSAAEDRERAEKFWLSFLSGGEEGDVLIRERRRELIRRTLSSCLQESGYLDLGGFITFRLAPYQSMLQETVDISMEEYLLDQQYEEFLQLLQYFVHFQEPITPLIHLIHHQGQEFSFFNQGFLPIHTASPGLVVAKVGDQELEMEDQVVSTLIALSPNTIMLHTHTPEVPIISTIRKIFGERLELCLECPHCSRILTSKREQECQGSS